MGLYIQFENAWAMSKSLQALGNWMIRRCTLTIGTLLVVSHSYGKSMNITQFADDKKKMMIFMIYRS